MEGLRQLRLLIGSQLGVGAVACAHNLGVMLQRFSPICMRALLLRQVVEQLADARVLRAGGRLLVKAARLHFHRTCLVPDRFEPEWPYQPDRLPVHETSDIVTAKERYVITELLPKEFDEAPPVARFSSRMPSKTASEAGNS